jgi:hypothetical protein
MSMTSELRHEAVTDQEAMVIRLREQDGLSLDEIASTIGKSKERVRQMIREAKARLTDFAENGDDALSRLPAHARKVMEWQNLRTRSELRAVIDAGNLWWSHRRQAVMWVDRSVRNAGWACWLALCEWCGLPRPVRGCAADDPPLPRRVRDLTDTSLQSLNSIMRPGLSAAMSSLVAATETEVTGPAVRKTLCGYFRFRPPGAKADRFDNETIGFISLYQDAQKWSNDQMESKLTEEKARLVELLSELPGCEEVVAKVTAEVGGSAETNTVGSAAAQMIESIPVLIDAALDGDRRAAEELLKNASWMTLFLQLLYKARPELFKDEVKKLAHLPVLATLAPGWVEHAEEDMERLGMGRGIVQGQFKDIAYRDGSHPCRAWARLAVESLQSNQTALRMHIAVERYLQSTQQTSIVLSPLPAWVYDCAEMPPYSKASARQWGRLAREMIRDQVPDFHEHREFRDLVSNAKMRMRDEPGAAQRRVGTLKNAILDRIAETIESIAL